MTISGKRQGEEEDADEGRARQGRAAAMVFSARLPMRISASTHDHQHRRLDAEQRAVDHRHAAAERVEQAQAQHHQRAGQHEQDAGGQSAAHAVQQPADVGRELLRLRPRQQHAEIERVQEARLVDPFLLVDHDAMHHRDLAGRPAEIDAADLEPDLEELAEARLRAPAAVRIRSLSIVVMRLCHAALAGQLWRSCAAKRRYANSPS